MCICVGSNPPNFLKTDIAATLYPTPLSPMTVFMKKERQILGLEKNLFKLPKILIYFHKLLKEAYDPKETKSLFIISYIYLPESLLYTPSLHR